MILPFLSTHFAFYLGWMYTSHMKKMSVVLISVGTVVLVFGIIFYLQGHSIVGPTSSFMYSNPKWIVNGQWIAVIGVLILAAGLGISLRRPRS